ncbi:MAG: type IV toxin-antitoxin system AbiEi family antitoxin domain-containing protein [Candidatus Altiarchaeota archaeon]|nr:type IV toxin-antitoxin system AbiEi family antitoxin domain-containing protein [Candidatus Altiarchaeota archaeon]
MDYFTLSKTLKEKKMVLFTLRDIEALFPTTARKTIKNNLTNWLRKGYLERLRRGLYEVVEPGTPTRVPDYYLANRLYAPSYVSLEAALSFYGIIPEEAASATSVSTRPTRIFRNKHGTFIYRNCKKEAFTGYQMTKIEGYKTLIADREKAFVDFIYFRLLDGEKDFTHERLNLTRLKAEKTIKYAAKYNKRTRETIKELLEDVVS